MNFFGHSYLAREERESSAFLLGSMLPDFFGMSRVRPRSLPPGEIGEGIAHHLRVDDAFHGAPTFVDLMRVTSTSLEAQGVRRGSARAVGHVGTELVLDVLLAEDEEAVVAYQRALRAELSPLDLEPEGLERLERLVSRLRAHGGPVDGRPGAVTARLEAALRGRPRLALDAGVVHVVEREIELLTERVFTRAPELLAEVRARLG